MGLLIIRMLLGVFFFSHGVGKLPWLGDAGPLTATFERWYESAPPPSRVYIDSIALPGVSVFAKLVPLSEIACGLALVLGAWTPWIAIVSLFMVMNFHVASGLIFDLSFLTVGLPTVACLIGLAFGGAGLPLSLTGRRRA